MNQINLPPDILKALELGAVLVLSVSGGKDSEAMTKAVLEARAAQGWPGPVHMVHADLGRMEWKETPAYIEAMSKRYAVPVSIVHRDHDLLEGIERRADKVAPEHKPGFPSSAARYCTAGWKRTTINSWLARTFEKNTTIVQCIGLRRDESKQRSKTPDCAENELASAKTKGRNVLNWYPIASWSTTDVWESLGVTLDELESFQAQGRAGILPESAGWQYHPAYYWGNHRLSCAMCVLADENDLRNGANHNPETYRALVDIEIKHGFAFQKNKPLYALEPGLLSEPQRAALAAQKEA